jgi:FMN-dependent NADH-azoreductase
MATLLRIDSSPLASGTSFSRDITDEIVRAWKEANPGGNVLIRDLGTTPLPALNAEWITAAYTPEAARTERQSEVLALSDQLIEELKAADEYVIGVPMHNFSVSGVLKLWIDQVARTGKTFSYSANGPEGLLKGKKLTLVLTSGGSYDPGTPLAAMDLAEPWLRTVFGFMGVTDVRSIRAGGTARARDESGRAAFLQRTHAALKTEAAAA